MAVNLLVEASDRTADFADLVAVRMDLMMKLEVVEELRNLRLS